MKSKLDFFTLERFSESAMTLNLLRKHLLQLAVTGVLYSVDDWDERMLEELSSQPIIDGDWIESKDQDPSGDIRLLQLADIGEGFFKDKSQRFINNDTFKRLNCTPLEKDDVLIARLPDPIGRACLFPELSQKCITVVDVAIVKVERKVILPEYLVMLMNSPAMNFKVIEHSAGTTRQRVATGKLKKMTAVFPSKLESQQNIINKYKEIKAIVERLDLQRQKRDEIVVFARKSAVSAISTAQSPEELQIAWNRIRDNWDDLVRGLDALDDLRDLILGIAFSGLLTRTSTFPLDDWEPTTLGVLCDVRDGTHDSPRKATIGYPLVTSKNLKKGLVDLEHSYLISESDYQEISKRSRVDKHDVLISMIGTVGQVAVVKDEPEYAIKNVGLIKTGSELLSRFVGYYLVSPQAKNYTNMASSGGVQKFLSLGKLRALPIKIPNPQIQEQIVLLLDRLMSVCEELEKSTIKANKLADRFTQSVLANSL